MTKREADYNGYKVWSNTAEAEAVCRELEGTFPAVGWTIRPLSDSGAVCALKEREGGEYIMGQRTYSGCRNLWSKRVQKKYNDKWEVLFAETDD